jgi:hypothetical protein
MKKKKLKSDPEGSWRAPALMPAPVFQAASKNNKENRRK